MREKGDLLLLFLFEKSVTANWASMVDRESKYGKRAKDVL